MEQKYTKLSHLVSDRFTILESYGYQFKKWDNDSKRFLVEEKFPGDRDYKKTYTVNTDKGKLDLTAGQLGQILEATFSGGKADIINKTIEVKSNGKTGIDIRYYLNLVRGSGPEAPILGYAESDIPPELGW